MNPHSGQIQCVAIDLNATVARKVMIEGFNSVFKNCDQFYFPKKNKLEK